MAKKRGWRSLVRRGGAWWIRWPIRLLIVVGLVYCCLLDYGQEVGGECLVEPLSERSVRAQVDSEILEIRVVEGQIVAAGEVVAVLAMRDERAAVATADAELARAKADLELLRNGARPEQIKLAENAVERQRVELTFFEAELARAEGLRADENAAQERLDRAKRNHSNAEILLESRLQELAELQAGARIEQIRAAEADVRRIEAQITYSREQIELGTITAPISGRVATPSLHKRIGHSVVRGDLILLLQDLSELRLVIAAEESAAARVQVGQRVKIRLNALDGELLRGSVETVGASAVDDSLFHIEGYRSDREIQAEEMIQTEGHRHVRVSARIAETEYRLVPGMTGQARIVIGNVPFWRALTAPFLRFFRVEVWSWLP
ncbi:MAG: HlyD family efflux transporter periplasmic adaptor subunit [Planctomycetota bacterium]